MKHNKLFILSLLAMLGACQVEEQFDPVDADLIPLNISGSVNQVPTKATAEGFVNGDALGLYAVNYSQNNSAAGGLVARGNQADNVQYVFDEQNQKWNAARPVYYKDANTHVDLYVYYPYQPSIDEVNEFNFEVKQDQSVAATSSSLSAYEASDFMWGKASDITPSESKVRVILDHKLAAVNVTLAEGEGFAEGEFDRIEKSVLLSGTTRKATIDLSTGVAVPLGSAQANGIVMVAQEDGSYRAIAIPQVVAAGTQLFSITLDGISYSYSKSSEVTYVAGKMSNFTLRLNKKVPTGEYEIVLGSTEITDWVEDRNSHGGDARQYFVVNVEAPGTLGQMIEDASKNPAKIRNLKVTGKMNENDFKYIREKMTIIEALNIKEVELCTQKLKYLTKRTNEDIEKDKLIYGEPVTEGSNYVWYSSGSKVLPNDALNGKSTLYYISLPEDFCAVGDYALNGTNFTGKLALPEDVEYIGRQAFGGTLITSYELPSRVFYLGNYAFWYCSSLQCPFTLPEGIRYLGDGAFGGCSQLYGHLVLPNSIVYLGIDRTFQNCSGLTGDLRFPDKITSMHLGSGYGPFGGCFGLNGHLDLNNLTDLSTNIVSIFKECSFTGEVVIPEGTVSISYRLFSDNVGTSCRFTKIVFPSTVKTIGDAAFRGLKTIREVVLPEGFTKIGENAFRDCGQLLAVELPSTLVSIGDYAFSGCGQLSKLVCKSTQPPIAFAGTFTAVPKDNFAVNVPESSITRYATATGWSQFKRIAGYYDFSISRRQMRTLNAGASKEFVLRAPSGFSWSVQDKPEWITVTPDHGVGKANVTITVSEMARTSDKMYDLDNVRQQIGTGRNGEVIFSLDEKESTTKIYVEQHDCEYSDGEAVVLQEHSVGNGIDLVFIGDGFDAKDIASGTFLKNVQSGVSAFFGVEPYATYRDRFNISAVISLSDESGIGTLNDVIDNKFGSKFTQNRILPPDAGLCFSWVRSAVPAIDFSKSVVIMLQNSTMYEGVALLYSDNSALACCPVSTEPAPYDFAGIIQHEAGGHAFGKLGDEYIYHQAYIQNCQCDDRCPHVDALETAFSRGWYKNLSLTGSMNAVPWKHLIFHPSYSDVVDVYEGGFMHSRGVFRSEPTSCMNNNIPYYSTISRQAIVERILDYSGEGFTLDKFYANDKKTVGTRSALSPSAPAANTNVHEHYGPIILDGKPL